MTSTWKKMLDLLIFTCSKVSLPEFSISKPLELLQPGSSAPSQQFGDKRESPGLSCCCSHWNELGLLQFSLSPHPRGSPSIPLVFIQRCSKAERWVAEVGCWRLGWKEGIQSLPFLLRTENSSAVHPGHLDPPRNPPLLLKMLLRWDRDTTAPRLWPLQKPLNFALPEFSKSSYNSKSTSIK